MIVSLVAMQAIISHRQYSKHDWLQKKYDVDMGPAGSTYLRYRYRKRARINIPLTHCPISIGRQKNKHIWIGMSVILYKKLCHEHDS